MTGRAMRARNPSRSAATREAHAIAKREAKALFGGHMGARREYIASRLAGRSRPLAFEIARAMVE